MMVETVLMMRGFNVMTAADGEEAWASGADGFEEKPLNMGALVAKIEGLLKGD